MPLNLTRRWGLRALLFAVSMTSVILLYGFVRGFLLRQNGVLYVAEPAIVKISSTVEGKVANATVNLRSISNRRVRIVGASTSCTCLVPGSQFPIELEPGESRGVHFKINLNDQIRQKGGTVGQATFFVEAESPPVTVQFITDTMSQQRADTTKVATIKIL